MRKFELHGAWSPWAEGGVAELGPSTVLEGAALTKGVAGHLYVGTASGPGVVYTVSGFDNAPSTQVAAP